MYTLTQTCTHIYTHTHTHAHTLTHAATSATRGAARGDCDIPLKKVYLNSRFSQLGQPGNGTISHRTLENQPHSTALKEISKHGRSEERRVGKEWRSLW